MIILYYPSVLLWDRASQWSRTFPVDQADWPQGATCLHLSSPGIRNMRHHTQHIFMWTLATELRASKASTESSPHLGLNHHFLNNVSVQLSYELYTAILIAIGKVFLSPLGGKIPENSRPLPSWVFLVWGFFNGFSMALNQAREVTWHRFRNTHAFSWGTLPRPQPKAMENLLKQAVSWISGSKSEPPELAILLHVTNFQL